MILIFLLSELSLISLLGVTGTARAAFVQKEHLARDFQDKLEQEMASAIESLVSLQSHISSFPEVVLQNRRALDLFNAEDGGNFTLLEKDVAFVSMNLVW